jgi:hypothetical protein
MFPVSQNLREKENRSGYSTIRNLQLFPLDHAGKGKGDFP